MCCLRCTIEVRTIYPLLVRLWLLSCSFSSSSALTPFCSCMKLLLLPPRIHTEIVAGGLKTCYLCLILTIRPWPPRLFFDGLSLCVSSVFRPVLLCRQAPSECNPLSESAFGRRVEKGARASDKIHQLCDAGRGLRSWLRGKLHGGKLSRQCIPALD